MQSSYKRYLFLSSLFLSALLAIKIDIGEFFGDRAGSFYVITFYALLSIAVYREINPIRLRFKDIFCDHYLNKSSISYFLCRGKIFSGILSATTALVISASITIFIFIAELPDLIVIFADIFAFAVLCKLISAAVSSQLTESVRDAFTTITIIFINTALLGLTYFTVTYAFQEPFEILDPALPDHVIERIQHSWKFFRHIARTAYFIDLNVFTFKNIPGIGAHIFALIYAASISTLPFIGISLILRRASRLKLSS